MSELSSKDTYPDLYISNWQLNNYKAIGTLMCDMTSCLVTVRYPMITLTNAPFSFHRAEVIEYNGDLLTPPTVGRKSLLQLGSTTRRNLRGPAGSAADDEDFSD